MVNKLILIVILISTGLNLAIAQGRIRGSNLMEFQLGNLPQLEPAYQSSLFNQLDLAYRYKSFGLDARIEQYYPSFGDDIDYTRLSQFKFKYNSDLLDIKVGNIYTSLGRGLLLRNYEIPGSIWETRGFRVRYGFYKDLLGAEVKLKYKNATLKAIRGNVLDVALPPTISDDQERRPDLVEGAEASYRFNRQSAGLIFMRHFTTNASGMEEETSGNFLSVYYDGNLFNSVSLYGEMAKKLNDDSNLYSLSNEAAYAGYVGISYSVLNFGVSLEYKDYHNFSLGTGINDPPTLVKEHSYRLLNRSTHVPILTDESGYQVELYYRTSGGSLLTLNSTRSVNEITNERSFVFQEYFAEYQFNPGKKVSTKIFIDYAKDPFVNEDNRYALGSYVDVEHKNLVSTIELEWQYIQRETNVTDQFSNYYFSYTLSKASKYGASMVVEFTKDPIQFVDDKSYNIYPSLNITYRPNAHNILTFFYGKRRGGPACNSGVCYDVLDFEGFELRLSSRF